MDTKATATLDFEIPAEDGSIAEALADLERKLTLWSDAIADAHAQLERVASATHADSGRAAKAQAAGAQIATPPPPANEIETTTSPTAAVNVEKANKKPTKAPKSSRAAVDQRRDAKRGKIDGAATSAAPASPATADPTEVRDELPANQRSVMDAVSIDADANAADREDPMAVTAELPPPDDQSLLESLDEDTRQTVQLMRRLSPTKSISELLEAHRSASSSAGDSKAKKKSWWKRGT